MRQKFKIDPPKIDSSAYPYITNFKEQSWSPYNLRKLPAEIYIPKINEIKFLFSSPDIKTLDLSLESIYNYLSIKKALGIKLNKEDYDLFNEIINKEVINEGVIGFSGKKTQSPDVISTYYALWALYTINMLHTYLEHRPELERRNSIVQFILALNKSKQFYHCLNSKCKYEKEESEYKFLFLALSILELIGQNPQSFSQHFLKKLKSLNKRNRFDVIFQLLCINYLNLKGEVEDDIIIKYQKYKTTDGGFNLDGGDQSNFKDTFWVSYILETYKWLIPYRSGPIFTNIIKPIMEMDLSNLLSNHSQFKQLSQIVSIVSIIFPNILQKLEEILISNFSKDLILDLALIVEETGIPPKYLINIIPIIDNKYIFNLKIENNEVRFQKYLNQLDTYLKKYAKKIYLKCTKESNLSITQIRKDYNKGLKKKHRIEDELIISIVKDMLNEKIVKGTLVSKHSLFRKKYYFTGVNLVSYTIQSDKIISEENIEREKSRLEEIKKDIYNMTCEINNSANNIMREIESLIIVGEADFAEERLEYNIKRGLFDAAFFNKTIESFSEEFELIKSNVLTPYIENWDLAYNDLKKTYQNIENILSKKIETLKSEKEQYTLVNNLEEFINKSIIRIQELLKDFQENFKTKITVDYSRVLVNNLKDQIKPIEKSLNLRSEEIKKMSFNIKSKQKDVKEKRRKIIDKWASVYEEFEKQITHYLNGFNIWEKKIKEIDDFHDHFVNKIEETGQNIFEKMELKNYMAAYKITDEDFEKISKAIESTTAKIADEMKEIYAKNRTLYPLLRQVENEWMLYQNILDNLNQQFRERFHSSIDMDIKTHLKEDYISIVNKEITQIREELIKFEKNMSSLFSNEKILSKSELISQIDGMQEKFKEKSKTVKEKFKEGKKKVKGFKEEVSSTTNKWESFSISFSKDLDSLKSKFQEELYIVSILHYSSKHKKIQFPITEIKNDIGEDEQTSISTIKKLIVQNRLNARLIDSQKIIEVHNEIWRKSQALFQYKKTKIRELENRTFTLEKFFENTLKNNTIHYELDQIRDLSDNLNQKIVIARDRWKLLLEEDELDPNYDLISTLQQEFYNEIRTFEEKRDKISSILNKIKEFEQFLKKQTNMLEDIINGKIHHLYNEIQKKKMRKFKKNLRWFNKEKEKLEEDIELVIAEVHKEQNERIKNNPQILPVLIEMENIFLDKKDSLLESFKNAQQDIVDKLSRLKMQQMRKDLENIIQKHQDTLNYDLQKYEQDIVAKINTKDFISAANKLKDGFQKEFEKDLKNYDKIIKSKNKEFIKETYIFEIKYSFLVERWELFLLNFLNTLHEKEMDLQGKMLKDYITMVINAYNEPYIPIDNISRDLKMKENLIQQLIMVLINNKELLGKIDQKYNIYIKEGEKIGSHIVNSLDAVRAKNVRAYLMFKRFGGLMRYITPIITVIFTLSSYAVSQVSSNPVTIAAPVLIALVILMPIIIANIYWLNQGRKKAIKGKIVSKTKSSTKTSNRTTKPPTKKTLKPTFNESMDEELNLKTQISSFSDDKNEDKPLFRSPYSPE